MLSRSQAQVQLSKMPQPKFHPPMRQDQLAQPPPQSKTQRHQPLTQSQRRSYPMQHQRQPHWNGKAPMRNQGYGMISIFVPTCHYCCMIGHIRPNCFKFIKRCRIKSMKEKRMKSKTKVHEPRESRNMMTMTTRN